MSQKTALILSDVHYGDLAHLENFGKQGVSSDEDLYGIATSIVDILSQEGNSIDFVFVLGDLTSRGSPGEFQDVYRFLLGLCKLLDVSEDNLFITYGNHDVDWSICKLKTEHVEHHNAYCVTAANLGSLFAPPGKFTVTGPVIGCGVTHLDGIDLISLNSGIECYDDQAIKHGKLGAEQFSWLQNELESHLRADSTKITILHHHLMRLPYAITIHDLSALEEGPNALDVLGKCGVDIVLHGHRHHPIAHTEIKSNWIKPITFFCAGSFGVAASERAQGILPNTIHTITFDTNVGNLFSEGLISSYQLNSLSEWEPLVAKHTEYPLNQQQWFGAADASQQAESEINVILSQVESALKKNDHIELPEYNSLPLALRCIFLAELNNLLQAKANSKDIEITGDYPKNCLASRSRQ